MEKMLEEESICKLKTKNKLDEKMQKSLNAPMLTAGLIMMIIGAVMIVAYIVLGVLSETVLSISEAKLGFVLWMGAVWFGIGLVAFFTARHNVKQKQLFLGLVVEYEFFDDYMIDTTYRAGEKVGVTLVRYTDLEKIRESKNFFLLYPNKTSVYPVDKGALTQEEQACLRSLLRLSPKKQ